jgi:hypothetical protein
MRYLRTLINVVSALSFADTKVSSSASPNQKPSMVFVQRKQCVLCTCVLLLPMALKRLENPEAFTPFLYGACAFHVMPVGCFYPVVFRLIECCTRCLKLIGLALLHD